MSRARTTTLVALGVLLLTSCSQKTLSTIAGDATDFVEETAVLVAAEAIARQLDDVVGPNGKIPVAKVQKVVAAYDTLAEVSFPDADGDGFVDGNRIQVSLNGVSACIRFETNGSEVSKGECPR
jgi:hypothetical protein